MSHLLQPDSSDEEELPVHPAAATAAATAVAAVASPSTPPGPGDAATAPYIPSSASPPENFPASPNSDGENKKSARPTTEQIEAAKRVAATAAAAGDDDDGEEDSDNSESHALSDVDDYDDDEDDEADKNATQKEKNIKRLQKQHEQDDADEDDPFLKGRDGKLLRRPLGTKKEIRELTELSRKTGDFSFAEGLEPDSEGYRPVTWTQLRHSVGFEKAAHKFKVYGKISMRDQANWDKIKRIGVTDKDGKEAFLYFYDNSPEKWEWEELTVGTELAVKSPRYHRFMDGSEGMRVESCASVCEVKPHMVTDEERLEMGLMHKKHGNEKFEKKLYDDAIDKYDEAIRALGYTFHDKPELEQQAKEQTAACHLNIAACFVGEKKWGQVEAPCRKALKINATVAQNTKAYFRIGQAQHELGNLVNATAALERALELQPGEPRVLQELEAVRVERFELTAAQKEMFKTKAEQRRQNEQKNNKQQLPAQQGAATAAAPPPSGRSLSPTLAPSASAAPASGSDIAPGSPLQQQSPGTPPTSASSPSSPASPAVVSLDVFFDKSHRFGFQRSVLYDLGGCSRPLEQEFDAVENIRDVAASASSPSPSVIKKHMLYRSASLVNMTKSDLAYLTQRLGVKTVIDLREMYEVASHVAARKKWVEVENKKRARVRLEMRKAEIEVRDRRDKGEPITSSSGEDDDDSDDNTKSKNKDGEEEKKADVEDNEEYELGEDGEPKRKKPTVEQEVRRDRNRVFRRRMRKLESRRTFSLARAIGGGGLSTEAQEDATNAAVDAISSSLGVPIEEYDEMLRRQDPTLRPVEYVDLEAHFHRVAVKCKSKRLSTYESKEYEEFAARAREKLAQVGAVHTTVPTREEWTQHEPVCLHIDFSSNTIFSLASYWVWVVVLFLGLLFQVQWAAYVIVQMTAARVGALSYYKSMLQHQRDEIKEVFHVLAEESNYPVLICCEMGKDRTGVLVALILMACGASKEFVCQDYARSKTTAQMKKKCADIGLTAEEWVKALPKTMDQLVSSIDSEGGIQSYLRGIGVSEETVNRVRANLCEFR